MRKTYTGPEPLLKGRTALVRPYECPPDTPWLKSHEETTLLAQFDDMALTFAGKRLGYDWHAFPREYFSA